MAAILQAAGYRTGLYTSPHLVDFRERIRVDGKMIPCEEVTGFVERYMKLGFDKSPSFFELTMVMAFEYFAKAKVDVAVIEVGLGGRLDSTNIISPCLSVITNISKDHTQFLGDTRRLTPRLWLWMATSSIAILHSATLPARFPASVSPKMLPL